MNGYPLMSAGPHGHDLHSNLPAPFRAPVPQQNFTYDHGAPISHTQQPLVTGTSVLGVKYDKGVMIAADNLASYGSLARFKDIQRLHPLGEQTVIGVAGDMSDYQYLQKQLDGILREEDSLSLTDSHPSLSPANIYAYLSNLYYHRRTKVNPLWNAVLVGGYDRQKKETFLGYVDLLGTTYSAPTLATGFGAHIAIPLLREAYEAKAGIDGKGPLLTEDEAEKLLGECMKVLFYRDARSINKYQIAKVSEEGVSISESKTQETYWKFAEGLRGYGAQEQ